MKYAILIILTCFAAMGASQTRFQMPLAAVHNVHKEVTITEAIDEREQFFAELARKK